MYEKILKIKEIDRKLNDTFKIEIFEPDKTIWVDYHFQQITCRINDKGKVYFSITNNGLFEIDENKASDNEKYYLDILKDFVKLLEEV